VGKPGASSLAIMQKIVIARAGTSKGAKVAFSISPSYFFTEKVNQDYYEGNFRHCRRRSFVQHDLGAELKRDAARRMIEYPEH